MTPPVFAENCAQLVPNWNSIGTPVTTPIAKERPKMRIQKRAASFHSGPSGAQADPLEDDDQQRQPHRELREEVVVGDGEAELQAVPEERIGHPVVSMEILRREV